VSEHDNGWEEWERGCWIDPKTRLPYSFMSIPTAEHIALYQQGIERVVKADRYAGLLVSMHCGTLYDRSRATMPSFSSKYIRPTDAKMVEDFLARLRLQQLRLKVDVRADSALREFAMDRFMEANAQRLEALDRLSLHLCLNPTQELTMEEVPVDDHGSSTAWELRPERDNMISLSPYPFRRGPLQASVLARRVPKHIYTSNEDFQKTLARAPYFAIHFTLRAGSAFTQTRVAIA
jgi:hypothetical protein